MFDISSDVVNVFVVAAVAVHSMAVYFRIRSFEMSKVETANIIIIFRWMMFENYLHCAFNFSIFSICME